jgi:hypothetical protein
VTHRRLTATPLPGLWSRPALAPCDLGQAVGYTLVFGKTIEACMQDGGRVECFQACMC